jgi:hypothetical protein
MTPLENSERNSDPAYPVRRSFSIQSLPFLVATTNCGSTRRKMTQQVPCCGALY